MRAVSSMMQNEVIKKLGIVPRLSAPVMQPVLVCVRGMLKEPAARTPTAMPPWATSAVPVLRHWCRKQREWL
eukprot:11219047-Lingulodinium_polyedra.AAC.1